MLKDNKFLNSKSVDILSSQIKQIKDNTFANEVREHLNSLEYDKTIIILDKILLEIEK